VENEDNTINERLSKIEEMCAVYEERIFINRIQIIDVDYNLSKEDLIKMASLEIYTHCYNCAKYLTALQKQINDQTGRYNWFDRNLDLLLNREYENQKGFSWQEKKANALKNNEVAKKMEETKQKFKMETDRLNWLVNRIQYQTDFASRIAYQKSKEEYVEKDRN